MNVEQHTVLIVDDEPINLNVLIETLGHEGLNVSVARSGDAALAQARKVTPDIILLDVLMPGIDGFETCRRLKEDPRTQAIPVIFMTALSDTENLLKGFDAGGVDYITKPVQIKEVLARVNTHITIQKLQTQLRGQAQHLEELNAQKDKYFSIIAHDLRSSFTGVLSFANFLNHLDDLEEETRGKLIHQFQDHAENLFALLDNLLNWSKVQRKTIVFQPEVTRLKTLVERNIKLLKSHAGQKHITLADRVQENLFVEADINMLDTVIRNLLTNAVKFTRPGGSVQISAHSDEGTVTVSVSDTGIGIPREKLPDLFRIDVRTQRSGTADEQGTGLGLILCKEFIEKHQGRIGVESEPEQGTTVWFSVPRHAVE